MIFFTTKPVPLDPAAWIGEIEALSEYEDLQSLQRALLFFRHELIAEDEFAPIHVAQPAPACPLFPCLMRGLAIGQSRESERLSNLLPSLTPISLFDDSGISTAGAPGRGPSRESDSTLMLWDGGYVGPQLTDHWPRVFAESHPFSLHLRMAHRQFEDAGDLTQRLIIYRANRLVNAERNFARAVRRSYERLRVARAFVRAVLGRLVSHLLAPPLSFSF